MLRVFTPQTVAGTARRRTRKTDFLVDAPNGTAEAGGATSITLQVGRASAVDSAYLGHWVVITSGTGNGQARAITAYTGSTRVATVAAWTVNPDATSVYFLSENGATFGTLLGNKAQNSPPTSNDIEKVARLMGQKMKELNGTLVS